MDTRTHRSEHFTFAEWAETLSGVGMTVAVGAVFVIVLAQVFSVIAR
jgi:hypothetical protein